MTIDRKRASRPRITDSDVAALKFLRSAAMDDWERLIRDNDHAWDESFEAGFQAIDRIIEHHKRRKK